MERKIQRQPYPAVHLYSCHETHALCEVWQLNASVGSVSVVADGSGLVLLARGARRLVGWRRDRGEERNVGERMARWMS